MDERSFPGAQDDRLVRLSRNREHGWSALVVPRPLRLEPFPRLGHHGPLYDTTPARGADPPMSQPAAAEPLNVPQRVLLGPGPSDVPPRVLQAMAAPTLGHLDPLYLRIMDETRRM